jgi:hypothetical protein
MGEGFTTIKVSKENARSLRSLRIAKRESYDEVLTRIIKKIKLRGGI